MSFPENNEAMARSAEASVEALNSIAESLILLPESLAEIKDPTLDTTKLAEKVGLVAEALSNLVKQKNTEALLHKSLTEGSTESIVKAINAAAARSEAQLEKYSKTFEAGLDLLRQAMMCEKVIVKDAKGNPVGIKVSTPSL